MNDYKNNWFYKMCSRQGGKNIIFIGMGGVLFLSGILFFSAVVSVFNVLLSLFGILMIILGGRSMFFSMPKLKEQMEEMSRDDFSSLGYAAPRLYYYGTFYFTDRYLCAPSAYAMIRYDKIKDIHAGSMKMSGQQSVFVNIEFTDGSPCMDINIKDYGTFVRNPDAFTALVQAYQLKMRVQ